MVIYLFIYIDYISWVYINFILYKNGWVKVTPGVTLSNVTPPNNLLWNSYFENLTVELHVIYALNNHANFHVN